MPTQRSSTKFASIVLLLFCCIASRTAAQSCYDGHYQVPGNKWTNGRCAGFQLCEEGHFCIDGKRHVCPAGTFGNSTGLSSPDCSGPCPTGYYCPSGSTRPTPCGDATVYCPARSSQPVAVEPGFYTTSSSDDPRLSDQAHPCPKGSYCVGGVKQLCPEGQFGAMPRLSHQNCSGKCPGGTYCPAGSTSRTTFRCHSLDEYCPPGSGRPSRVRLGTYALNTTIHGATVYWGVEDCPAGSYCVGGKRYLCLAGRYGDKERETNSSCTGECDPGYYCAPGSVTARQHACVAPNAHCPAGSTAPISVDFGHYTVGVSAQLASGNDVPRAAQKQCEPGYFCVGGMRYPCASGRFGTAIGSTAPACDGKCDAGYWCEEASTSATQHECGAVDVFCPEGALAPLPVDVGSYTVGPTEETRTKQRPCEPGYWCQGGKKHLCPAGRYGSEYSLASPTCSGLCAAGYSCPEGSTHADKLPCGSPDVYCPSGSSVPTRVGTGYYSTGGTTATRTGQQLAEPGYLALQGLRYACPAGRYGIGQGMTNTSCTGSCANGYYCPPASTSPFQHACGGDSVFCPVGSPAPRDVAPGFYTASYEREACPPGQYRPPGIDLTIDERSVVATAAPTMECAQCPNGTYKPDIGDALELCHPCEEWSSVPDETSSTCVCHRASGGKQHDPATEVLHFNMSTGLCEIVPASIVFSDDFVPPNTSATRYRQFECEPGYYCIDGVRRICPAGRWGSRHREQSSDCEGVCEAGYFCLQGSATPRQHECGGADRICPEGSSTPQFVDEGFYSNPARPPNVRTEQHQCPPGSWCRAGLRFPCECGYYGNEPGLTEPQCSGICPRGYYCPAGSDDPTAHTCGDQSFYCPPGSWEPTRVSDGYYTINAELNGGEVVQFVDPDAMTASGQLICEVGFYCIDGVKRICPEGTFGLEEGLSDPMCSGACTAGFTCPAGSNSSEPVECGDSEFYCPPGEPGRDSRRVVGGGYYTIGGNSSTNSTRTGQKQCEPGYWCSSGIKQPCIPGYYGHVPGLQFRECSGLCPPGFYCPEATSEPLPCENGRYSVGGSADCMRCPNYDDIIEQNISLICANSRLCCFHTP